MNDVPFWELCTGALSELLTTMTQEQLITFATDFYGKLPWDRLCRADRVYPMVIASLCCELKLAQQKIEFQEELIAIYQADRADAEELRDQMCLDPYGQERTNGPVAEAVCDVKEYPQEWLWKTSHELAEECKPKEKAV